MEGYEKHINIYKKGRLLFPNFVDCTDIINANYKGWMIYKAGSTGNRHAYMIDGDGNPIKGWDVNVYESRIIDIVPFDGHGFLCIDNSIGEWGLYTPDKKVIFRDYKRAHYNSTFDVYIVGRFNYGKKTYLYNVLRIDSDNKPIELLDEWAIELTEFDNSGKAVATLPSRKRVVVDVSK